LIYCISYYFDEVDVEFEPEVLFVNPLEVELPVLEEEGPVDVELPVLEEDGLEPPDDVEFD
jgi:hypothetical protein